MEPISTRRSFLLGLSGASAAAALTLAGCGSGGSSSAKGKGETAKISIKWPTAASRFIASNIDLITASTTSVTTTSNPASGVLYFKKPYTTDTTTGYMYGLVVCSIKMTANAYGGYEKYLADNSLTDSAENAADFVAAGATINATKSDTQTGENGDTLIFNLAMVSTASQLAIDLTDTTAGTETTQVKTTTGTATYDAKTDATTVIDPYATDETGAPVLTPNGSWAFESDDITVTKNTDGTYSYVTPTTPGTYQITMTWTPDSAADSAFMPTTINPTTLTITVAQAYHRVMFKAEMQGTNIASIINANFSWKTNKTTYGTGAAAGAADTAGTTFKSGDVVWVATGAQTVTLSFASLDWTLDFVIDDNTAKDYNSTTPKTGENDIAIKQADWAEDGAWSVLTVKYQATTGVNAEVIIS